MKVHATLSMACPVANVTAHGTKCVLVYFLQSFYGDFEDGRSGERRAGILMGFHSFGLASLWVPCWLEFCADTLCLRGISSRLRPQ